MVKRLTVFAATFVVVMFSFSYTAYAQVACGPRTDVVKRLANKYQEFQVAMGLSVSGNLVEVFVSKEGAFTILLSEPNGQACIATTGHNWATEDFPEVPKVGT
tara:strand:- start:475 stop:783 length:309 start_codon:yes stop_codon:yes gene_type:complete